MAGKKGWRVVPGGVEIDVIVSPNSGRSEVQGFDHWRDRLVVKVRAPPDKGGANCELVGLLGDELGAKVEVVFGHTSRTKTVLASGNPTAMESKLEAWRARS